MDDITIFMSILSSVVISYGGGIIGIAQWHNSLFTKITTGDKKILLIIVKNFRALPTIQ